MDNWNKTLEKIEEFIDIQREEYEKCKEARTTRMKNADSKNWGMANAEGKIEALNEFRNFILGIKVKEEEVF